jgi:hypothetical protein
MKFGKLLQDFNASGARKRQRRESESPQGRPADSESSSPHECYLDYKQMKKLLKRAAECKEKGQHADMQALEKQFVTLLHEDLDRINAHFIESEEDSVISLQSLRDEYDQECRKRTENEAGGCVMDDGTWFASTDVRSIRGRFVDLHGELVLLLHWSIMNYAGMLKILKKHDKLLGGHAQKDLLGTILKQPFTSTSGIASMASCAEMYVQRLGGELLAEREQECVSLLKQPGVDLSRANSLVGLMDEADKWAKEKGIGHGTLLEKTRAALVMLNELQSSAHSPSTLPGGHAAIQRTSVST